MDELDSKLWHLFPYGEAQVGFSIRNDGDPLAAVVLDRYSKLLRAVTQPNIDEQKQVKE
jgi:hypothetical protein